MTTLLVLALAAAAGAAAALRSRSCSGPPRRLWVLVAPAAAAWCASTATSQLVLPGTLAGSGAQRVAECTALVAVLAWSVLAVVGLSLLSAPYQTRGSAVRDALDLVLLALAGIGVLWMAVLGPVWNGGQVDATTWAASAAMVVALVVLLMVSHALVRAPHRDGHLRTAVVGLALVAVGDVGAERSHLAAGQAADASAVVVWTAGWALVLTGALLHRRRPPVPVLRAVLTRGATMAHAAAAITVATAAVGVVTAGAPDPVSSWLSAGALALVTARTLVELRRTSRLQRRLERKVEDRTRQLADSRHRFAALVSQSSDPVLVLDAGGRVVDANPGTAELLGLPPGSPLDLLASEQLRAAFQALVSSGADHLEVRLALQHADGHRVDVDAVLTDLLDDPDVRGVVLNGRDVTTALRLERELSDRAFNDALTGLPNRALFRDRLEHALRARASRAPVKLVYLDLDGFKAVNDSLGHDAGDELLVVVAQRLQEVVREADTVARLGGDEFAVLLEEGALLDDAERLARRICDAVRQPAAVRGVEVRVAASVGLASSRVAGHDAEALMRSADLAMYQAKAAGRGGHAVYQPSMHEALVERVQMEADLRRAVDQGEFRVVYQPLVDMGTGGVSGVEALVRWHHPEHGVVVPAEFIPLAESTGLIDAIGAFVLREACQQVATWRAEVPGAEQMRLSANLSGHQLGDPGLVSAVVEALSASGLPATSLVLEVTESVFVGQDDAALEVLEALRALGVRLAIDDFGTGYSSLSYLHRLPVDIIKIDKSFVDRLSDAGDLSLVDAIVGMADVLGLATVAEGVEHEHQRAALAAQGCTTGQGYHFSPPVEPHLLPELVVGALPARAAPASEPASDLASDPAPEPVGGSAGA